jgi:biotin carboxyl carrier protein
MPAIRIESIAAGGDGVGRLDGLAVFTPRTAPGELVDVSTRQQGRLARGRLLRVLEPSPHRVAPRCRHYDGDHCGGCQLQHLSIDAQRSAKQRIVQDAFARIARRPVELPEIVPSPSEWEYRSRLTLAMRWRNGAWTMGLHRYDDVDSVFDLHECPITDPRIVAAWTGVRQAAQWLPRAPELRGTVRLAGSELALMVEGGESWPNASEFVDAVPMFDVIRWRPTHGGARVIVDRRPSATPEQSFDQVNPPVAAAARNEIVERALAGSQVTAEGTHHRLAVQRGEGRGQYAIWSDDHRFEVEALDERRRAIQDMTGAAAANTGPAPLVAPMPGLVVRVNVKPGEQVEAGQPLVVMEAMKMENELRSLSAGTVKAVRFQPGAAVEKGAVLVELVGS